MTSDSDFKKYSLEKFDEWFLDALNCDEISSKDIYDTIAKSLYEISEYHKKQLDKTNELLSLLSKISSPISNKENITIATKKDIDDFWNCQKDFKDKIELTGEIELIEEMELDKEIEFIRKSGGFEWTPESKHSKYYYETDRNK